MAVKPPLSRSHVAEIEKGKANSPVDTLHNIRAAFERNRVEFLPREGVRILHPLISEDDQPNANRRLLDDIFTVALQHKLQGGSNEILIFGLGGEEDTQASVGDDFLTSHQHRLKEAGLQEKILCGPNTQTFIAPRSVYRRLRELDESPNTVHVYGNRVAVLHWHPTEFVITIESEPIASALRSMFNLLWKQHGGID